MTDLNIALVSGPWPLFNRPSIQLGALKAFLLKNFPQVKVKTYHLYLDFATSLGLPIYKEISESSWLAEPVAAALLYPENFIQVQKLWVKKATRSPVCRGLDFRELSNSFHYTATRLVNSIDWQKYSLVGFSICFSQLTSSLYLIRLIKNMVPSLQVVVGGSGCAGEMGSSLLKVFNEIDYVIQGEGELPLLELAKAISGTPDSKPLEKITGLLTRENLNSVLEKINQVQQLDDLPVPDFDDYFEQLARLPATKRFLPRIPLEISRGCWWKNARSLKSTGGCAFCNLNLQWKGYRHKSPEKIKSELKTVVNKYENLSISFMDNLLPNKGLKEIFEKIHSLKRDFRLFSEIRATTPAEMLAQMAQAGMRELQVGIEALSTSLLKKINKGTRAIDNLQIMKNCEIPGFPKLTGNLILEFPSANQEDVDETLVNLEFAMYFSPLKAISFWLGYGSPIWLRPQKFGIKRLTNHSYYRILFPKEVLSKLTLIIQNYEGGVRYQRKIWKPVREKVETWQKAYAKMHDSPRSLPILYYEDGQDFLIIHQRRLGTYDMTHKLKGSSRKIYLFCESHKHLKEIHQAFPSFTLEQIMSFLEMMVKKKLMFQEGERFLSLAVPLTYKKKF